MRTIGVFVDTSTVNRMLDIDVRNDNDSQYEEDREYLTRVVEQYAKSDIVRFIVNPTVKGEIENTKDPRRRTRLLDLFDQLHFTSYNISVFPLHFPVAFLTEEEKRTLKEIFQDIPSFKKDEKIFADAVFNSQIEVLLTTDRQHLANDTFRSRIQRKGLDEKIKVCTPKELFEHLQTVATRNRPHR
ncbi:MAG: hypothetical protein WBH57_08005 [Anaerolineae bacterium]